MRHEMTRSGAVDNAAMPVCERGRSQVTLLAMLSVLLQATVAAAQGWPLPANTPNTTVHCDSCTPLNLALDTVGYAAPIATFTGRFLDSSMTRAYGGRFPTAR